MITLPISMTANINISLQCSKCHQEIEATYILTPETNQIVASIDLEHTCVEQPLSLEAKQLNRLSLGE